MTSKRARGGMTRRCGLSDDVVTLSEWHSRTTCASSCKRELSLGVTTSRILKRWRPRPPRDIRQLGQSLPRRPFPDRSSTHASSSVASSAMVRYVVDSDRRSRVTNGVDLERRLSRDVEISHNSPSSPTTSALPRFGPGFLSAWGLHTICTWDLVPKMAAESGPRRCCCRIRAESAPTSSGPFLTALGTGTSCSRSWRTTWPDDDHAPLHTDTRRSGMEGSISEEDRVVLRKGHVSTFYERGNRVYAARAQGSQQPHCDGQHAMGEQGYAFTRRCAEPSRA